jgi:hypothetical protein
MYRVLYSKESSILLARVLLSGNYYSRASKWPHYDRYTSSNSFEINLNIWFLLYSTYIAAKDFLDWKVENQFYLQWYFDPLQQI